MFTANIILVSGWLLGAFPAIGLSHLKLQSLYVKTTRKKWFHWLEDDDDAFVDLVIEEAATAAYKECHGKAQTMFSVKQCLGS